MTQPYTFTLNVSDPETVDIAGPSWDANVDFLSRSKAAEFLEWAQARADIPVIEGGIASDIAESAANRSETVSEFLRYLLRTATTPSTTGEPPRYIIRQAHLGAVVAERRRSRDDDQFQVYVDLCETAGPSAVEDADHILHALDAYEGRTR